MLLLLAVGTALLEFSPYYQRQDNFKFICYFKVSLSD